MDSNRHNDSTHRDRDSRGREQSARDTQEGNYQDSSSGYSNKQKWGDLPRNRKGSP